MDAQCRVGKRNGVAAVKMAVDMANEKLIRGRTPCCRQPLRTCSGPSADARSQERAGDLGDRQGPSRRPGRGLRPRSRSPRTKRRASRRNRPARSQDHSACGTNQPEDVHGMHAAQAILTAKGGMTSHAALVARAVGGSAASSAVCSRDRRRRGNRSRGDRTLRGGLVTSTGPTAKCTRRKLPLVEPDLARNRECGLSCTGPMVYAGCASAPTPTRPRMRPVRAPWCRRHRPLPHRHMFYGEGSDAPL